MRTLFVLFYEASGVGVTLLNRSYLGMGCPVDKLVTEGPSRDKKREGKGQREGKKPSPEGESVHPKIDLERRHHLWLTLSNLS